MKAIWENTVIAESNQTIVVEGKHYFPSDTIKKEYFVPSDTHTTCHWKGVASYYSIKIGEKINKDAGWFYPETKKEAKSIEGYIAFWKGVKIIE